MFRFKKIDFFLFLPIVFLLGFGLIIISSISPNYLSNHLFYVLISLVVFLLFSFVDMDVLYPFSPVIYLLSIGFLVLPFIFGTVTRGAVRWIHIGTLTIQPSEIVKPFLALFSAWYWSKKEFSFRKLLVFCLFFVPVLLLIFFQPDLGSTLVVFSILLGTVLLSKIRIKDVLFLSLLTAFILPAFWFLLKDYQKTRIIHFINPYLDPLGDGYNLIQSKIAVGSGGLFGRGLGHGTQSHLAFLPERHTDFIFASLSEEMGLFGGMIVIILFLILFLRILKIAKESKERHFFMFVMGLFFYLFFQTVVNIGMNIGLLPITGITLPLVSYGGSSLLATMISFGFIEAVSRKKKDEQVIEIK